MCGATRDVRFVPIADMQSAIFETRILWQMKQTSLRKCLIFVWRSKRREHDLNLNGDKLRGHRRLKGCGLSDRTITALVMSGVDAPERLLSMTTDQLRLIRGIGPGSMKEVERYRVQSELTDLAVAKQKTDVCFTPKADMCGAQADVR